MSTVRPGRRRSRPPTASTASTRWTCPSSWPIPARRRSPPRTRKRFPSTYSPPAPASVTFPSTITNLNNSSPDSELQFQVNGVIAGATVDLYVGGTLIGTGTVPIAATSVTIQTNGTAPLSVGGNSITATQTLESRSRRRRQPEHDDEPGQPGLRGAGADGQPRARPHGATPHAGNDPPEHARHVRAEQLYQQRLRNPPARPRGSRTPTRRIPWAGSP